MADPYLPDPSCCGTTSPFNPPADPFFLPAQVQPDLLERLEAALGSDVVAETGMAPRWAAGATNTVPTGTMRLHAAYLPRKAQITGLVMFIRTPGVYVASGLNQFVLYKQVGNNAELVAQTPNDPALFTGAIGYVTANFAAPYDAEPGLYYVGMVHNGATPTTAPMMASISVGAAAMNKPPGGAFTALLSATVTAGPLPASLSITGGTPSTLNFWAGLVGTNLVPIQLPAL